MYITEKVQHNYGGPSEAFEVLPILEIALQITHIYSPYQSRIAKQVFAPKLTSYLGKKLEASNFHTFFSSGNDFC